MDGTSILQRARGDLHTAEGLEQVQHIVRTAARDLASAHGATFVLREDNMCFYADEDAIAPLWKGQRFPIDQCISGWAMLNGRPAVVPDIRVDPRIPQAAYAPTFVRSLVMVPVDANEPMGAIGVYWARTRLASPAEVETLTDLAEATAGALRRVENEKHQPGRHPAPSSAIPASAGFMRRG